MPPCAYESPYMRFDSSQRCLMVDALQRHGSIARILVTQMSLHTHHCTSNHRHHHQTDSWITPHPRCPAIPAHAGCCCCTCATCVLNVQQTPLALRSSWHLDPPLRNQIQHRRCPRYCCSCRVIPWRPSQNPKSSILCCFAGRAREPCGQQ